MLNKTEFLFAQEVYNLEWGNVFVVQSECARLLVTPWTECIERQINR